MVRLPLVQANSPTIKLFDSGIPYWHALIYVFLLFLSFVCVSVFSTVPFSRWFSSFERNPKRMCWFPILTHTHTHTYVNFHHVVFVACVEIKRSAYFASSAPGAARLQ